jgi:hypothetical protein
MSRKNPPGLVQNTGVLDNGANYESSIQHAQIGILDAGECLVDNVEAIWQGNNYVANSTFESGLATGRCRAAMSVPAWKPRLQSSYSCTFGAATNSGRRKIPARPS